MWSPDEYVRVCSAHGAGFFYIPGSDTCIKLGGRVRFEYQYGQTYNRRSDMTGMRALGRFELDARTSTEYGLLRAYTRVNFARRTGQIYSGTQVRIGGAYTGSAYGYSGAAQTQVEIDRAFIQLGGLTAGRAVSFFGFYNGDLELVGTTAGDGLITNLLAYTATFGSGFSATLSLEDPIERRNAIRLDSGTASAGIGVPTGAGTTPYGSAYGLAYATGGSSLNAAYGGASMPDIVAALRVDQSWGSAQLSGLLHQVRVAGGASSTPGYAAGTDYGFAVNAGVKINLPMLAKGDAFYLQGTWSQGATSTVLANPQGWGSGEAGVGRLTVLIPDAVIVPNGAAGSLSLTSVWGITAGVLHYWTPTIRQALFGSYIGSDIPSAAYINAGGNVQTNALRDASYWTIGSNVIWSPIKGLDIGAELNYLQINASGSAINGGSSQGKMTAVGATFGESSALVGRLRIQRDF
ncbi:porin [Rhizobiales bacterium TNE-4]|nr:porin [Rhizobiales bacterium TNE-4]MBV1826719.1 porin [Rhizobiales bacterium TNE-4]